MTNVERLLEYIGIHYQVIDRVNLSKIIVNLELSIERGLEKVLEAGWQHEVLNGYDDKFYHPNVKDKNSMIDMTDFKKMNIKESYIDDTAEEKLE